MALGVSLGVRDGTHDGILLDGFEVGIIVGVQVGAIIGAWVGAIVGFEFCETVIFRIRLLERSAMYTLPVVSTAIPQGLANVADVASPPSPL